MSARRRASAAAAGRAGTGAAPPGVGVPPHKGAALSEDVFISRLFRWMDSGGGCCARRSRVGAMRWRLPFCRGNFGGDGDGRTRCATRKIYVFPSDVVVHVYTCILIGGKSRRYRAALSWRHR